MTLLESLVVVAIVALIAMITVPNVTQALHVLSLRESARTLQADLRVARATAMRTGQPVRVNPLPDSEGYDWIGGTRKLPSDIQLEMSQPVVFFADGSMVATPIEIASRGRRIAITMNVATGAITAGAP
jgi:type II secretory pathway pseudopilin PulG